MMHETTRSAGGRPTSLALSLAIVVLSRAAPVHALDEPFRIDLVSSYDGAPTWSMVHVPDGYDPLVPVPLVLSCHGMGGDAHSAIDGVYKQTNSRGWLAVAPHTHGERSDGQTSLAARAAQHDLIDLIDWMVENYAVDEERIYLTGASMGGLQSSMSAAKYPHVFAAAWEWMGPADVEEIWYELDGSLLFQELADDTVIECGGTPDEQLFEYRRRSPADFAMNLRTVPF
ncbi:MAG: prolyl oligopeptidase family serine peptidase, partial [Planctomycetota bacterium]|nr:prolyl oligopeptidase family serine peptidase [Planctomycetota bacterium]